MRQRYLKMHVWLAVPLGLFILVMCFSGAVLLYEKELTHILRLNHYTVSPEGEPLGMQTLLHDVSATLPEGAVIAEVAMQGFKDEPWIVTLAGEKHDVIAVNQYTGEVLGRVGRHPFFTAMSRLHHCWSLGNGGGAGWSFGKVIVGVLAVASVLLLISALVASYIRNFGHHNLPDKVDERCGLHKRLYSFVVSNGPFAAIYLLFLILTGLVLLFHPDSTRAHIDTKDDDARQVQSLSGIDAAADDRRLMPVNHEAWQRALDEVYAKLESKPRGVTISDGTVNVAYRSGSTRYATDIYHFDKATGEVQDVQLYDNQPFSYRFHALVEALHTGKWLKLLRTVTFLGVIYSIVVSLAGYCLLIRTLQRRRK